MKQKVETMHSFKETADDIKDLGVDPDKVRFNDQTYDAIVSKAWAEFKKRKPHKPEKELPKDEEKAN